MPPSQNEVTQLLLAWSDGDKTALDDFLIGGFGIAGGPINPSLYCGRMNAFDARHSFRAQAFEPLLDAR